MLLSFREDKVTAMTMRRRHVNIPRNLNKILDKQGVTQAELARRTGQSSVEINYYAKGSRYPNACNLVAIAEALDVPLDDLVR